jgi:hypothetical protein
MENEVSQADRWPEVTGLQWVPLDHADLWQAPTSFVTTNQSFSPSGASLAHLEGGNTGVTSCQG